MKRLERLGSGATSTVYKMCPSGGAGEDLFEGVVSIDLYLEESNGTNPIVKVNRQDDIKRLSKQLCNRIDYAWKVFEPSSEFPDLKTFKDELSITNKINNIYGDFADDFLTTAPIKVDSWKINGIAINFPNKTKYVLFVKAGNNKYWKEDIDIIKFCEDILESLVVLNSRGYRHNDIKWENIVKCGDKFTLIDWGFCDRLDKIIQYGDMGSINPIKLYILNKKFVTAEHFFEQEEMGLYLPPEEYHGFGPIPGEIYRRRKIIGLEPIEKEIKILERRLAEMSKSSNSGIELSSLLEQYKSDKAREPLKSCLGYDDLYDCDGSAKLRRKIIEHALTPGLYLETLRRRKKEYYEELKGGSVIRDTKSMTLMAKFKETFDVYMLGMTVLSLVVPGRTLLDIGGHESQRGYNSIVKVPSGAVQSRPAIMEDMRDVTLDEQPLISKEIVRKFTSLKEPLNPTQALEYIRSISAGTPSIAIFNETGTPRPKAPAALGPRKHPLRTAEEAKRAKALATQKQTEYDEIVAVQAEIKRKRNLEKQRGRNQGRTQRSGGFRNRKTRKQGF